MPAQPRWILKDAPDPELVDDFAKEFGLAPAAIALALQRGFADSEAMQRFFQPRLQDLGDPFLLPGMEAAVERVLAAVDGGEEVVIYGDYDVDGVSSVALLQHILAAYGLETRAFVPERLEEGYGLSEQGIERCFAEGERPPDLVIAADCGTNSRAEADRIRALGSDLVVLDHHEPSPDGVADCAALVNPKLGDDHHYLCTGGVVFKLGHALLKARPLPGFDLREVLDLVALATIADIVPLEEENRIFARKGLAQLDRTLHPGLAALKEVAGVKMPARSGDVGFRLGPRLNASGRLDTAMTSLKLLVSRDPEEAEALAEELDQRNRDRQEMERRTSEEAEEQIRALPSERRSHAIVVGGRGWHAGVVGIVASRICRRYHRPTFVIAIDEEGVGKGSGRSVEGVSLVRALESAKESTLAGGGHEMAAGVTLREECLDGFREAVTASVAEQCNGDTLVPKLAIDAELHLSELTLELLDSYELLRPFGEANPRPLFMSRGVEWAEEPRIIKERHLKFRFTQGDAEREAIYFQSADLDLPNPPWDIAYTIDRNEWRGRVSLNVVIQAVRKAE